MKKNLLIILVILIILGISLLWNFFRNQKPISVVTNFEECVEAGNLVMESYPRQCRAGDQLFIENIVEKTNDTKPPVACTMEAKICPDGSAVGRTGPNCEFLACPSSIDLPIKVSSSLGENTSVLDLTISPKEVVSDSRCPSDVQCIWAGTVEVRTTLATQVAHGEHVLTLGKPQIFGKYSITLIEVLPNKTQEAIANNSYRFKYLVSLN